MDSQSFLVTGGCGLQGSDIVRTLRERYPAAKVSVLSRSPTVNTIPGVTYRKCNITNTAHVDACLRYCKPTVVFHCAATVVGTRKHVPDHLIREVNVEGTEVLLEKCKAAGVKAFIFTSSASVVQWAGVEIVNANETWPVVAMPDEENDGNVPIYPRTKAEAEVLVLAADDTGGDDKNNSNNDSQGGMRTCSIRPSVIYGERDNDVTPTIMRTADAMRGLQIGPNAKPFATTYVGNSTHAHLLAAEKLLSPTREVRDAVGGQAFFVANDGTYTYWGFARTMWQYHNQAKATDAIPFPTRCDADEYDPEKNAELRVVSIAMAMWVAWVYEWWAWIIDEPPRLSQTAVSIMTSARAYNLSKAKRVLGYREQVDWEEGCRRAATWWVENRKGKEVKEIDEEDEEFEIE
jgi:sterol-4alpha-carboxylate 3-dehydrogenase (decarboxylating)